MITDTGDFEQTAVLTVSPSDFRFYSCSGINELKTVSTSFELKKAEIPAKPEAPTSIKTNYKWVDLAWKAPESIGIPITKYIIIYSEKDKDEKETTVSGDKGKFE